MSGIFINLTNEQRSKLSELSENAGFSDERDYIVSLIASGKADATSVEPGPAPASVPDSMDVNFRGYSASSRPMAAFGKGLDTAAVAASESTSTLLDNDEEEPVVLAKGRKFSNLPEKYCAFNVIGPKGDMEDIPSNHYSFEIIDIALTKNPHIGLIPYFQNHEPDRRTAFNVEIIAKITYAEGNPKLLGSLLAQNWFFGDDSYSYNRMCVRMSQLLDAAGITNVEYMPNYSYKALKNVNLTSLIGLEIDTHIEITSGKNSEPYIYMNSIEKCTNHRR